MNGVKDRGKSQHILRLNQKTILELLMFNHRVIVDNFYFFKEIKIDVINIPQVLRCCAKPAEYICPRSCPIEQTNDAKCGIKETTFQLLQ